MPLWIGVNYGVKSKWTKTALLVNKGQTIENLGIEETSIRTNK